jgi:PKD repeat protein
MDGDHSLVAVFVPSDTTPPTGSLVINGYAETTTSLSVTLTIIANDPESEVVQMRFSNDGSSWSNWEPISAVKYWNLTAGEGLKTVHVQYRNGIGLTASYSASIKYGSDVRTEYDLVVSVTGSGFTSPSVGSYAHEEGTEVSVTASAAFGWTFSHWLLDLVEVGDTNPYTVTIDRDHSLTAIFTGPLLDTTPPIGSVVINEGTETTDSLFVDLILSAVDPESDVVQMRFSNDGSSWSSWETFSLSKSWALTSGEGLKTVYVQFRNEADLVSNSYQDTIILNLFKAPVASFVFSSVSLKEGDIVMFDASDSSDSDGSIDSYAWTFGDGSFGSGMNSFHSFSPAGFFNVTLTIIDNDGLVGTATETITIFPPDLEAPTASFTFSPDHPEKGEPVDFNAQVSFDSDGTIEDYDWIFGDGNTAEGVITSHSFSSVGTYAVTLKVTDDDGLSDTTTKILIVSNSPESDTTSPVAVAGNDVDVEVGSSVIFDAGMSSDDVGIVSFIWDFGDGTSGTGMDVSHSYYIEGNYIVYLRVTDAAGNVGVDSLYVTVGTTEDVFSLWILVPIIGSITVITAILFFIFIRKRNS